MVFNITMLDNILCRHGASVYSTPSRNVLDLHWVSNRCGPSQVLVLTSNSETLVANAIATGAAEIEASGCTSTAYLAQAQVEA